MGIYDDKNAKAERWAADAQKQYDKMGQESEAKVRVSISIPQAYHEEIIGLLPSMYGQRVGKHNRPRKPTITEYVNMLIADDLARRRKGGEDGR